MISQMQNNFLMVLLLLLESADMKKENLVFIFSYNLKLNLIPKLLISIGIE